MIARPRVLTVYGTRPEAIKMAPLIRALNRDGRFDVMVATTGQHRDLVSAVNAFFGIRADADLAVGRPGQSLNGIAASCLAGLDPILERWRPDLVVVHGDTTTSSAAALAAYYRRIPVAHLEAGLRSGDLASPYPEEGNRRVTAQLTALDLAPTPGAKANLSAEGVPDERIVVTGNTVIDALMHTVSRPGRISHPAVRAAAASGRRLVLLTGHRRESWECGLADVAHAVAQTIAARPGTLVVAPLHPNPIVRRAIEPALGVLGNALLCDPLDYPDFCRLLDASYCVVTDSGGIQEEAPALGKPVLVTRDTTERPEAIAAGCARLVGTSRHAVAARLAELLDDPSVHGAMSHAANPYGDGHGARRAEAAIEAFFGIGNREPDFDSRVCVVAA